eukprot:3271247-Prymnesium_polylepis.1
MTGSPPPSSALEQDTSSKSNERLEIARFLIRITNHSLRGLITAVLPPFPERLPKIMRFARRHKSSPPSSAPWKDTCTSAFSGGVRIILRKLKLAGGQNGDRTPAPSSERHAV